MNQEEREALNDLRLLVKKANQRILSLERLTDMRESFAAKELFDYLSSKDLNMITKSGRVRFSLKYDLNEIKILNKALSQFFKRSGSSVKKIKSLKKEYEQEIAEEIGIKKKITYKQANVIYQSGKHYTWIYEYIPKSEFWSYYVVACNNYNWSSETWINQLKDRVSDIPDEELRKDLESLYIYIKT